MKPPVFEVFSPKDLEEALALLAKYEDDAKLISGGQSLVPALNMRLARLKYLIDLNGLKSMEYIREENGKILIGGLTRHHTLESSTLLRECSPLLAEAAGFIGHLAIRYRGTIGGSLAHADPSATLPVAVLTLDATIRAASVEGVREFPATEFFYGIFTTCLQPNEILTEVEIPVQSRNTGHGFVTLTRRHGDFPLVAAGALLEIKEGKIATARLAVGGVNPVAERIDAAEQMLAGQEPCEDLFKEAAEKAKNAMDAETDMHATAEYRVHMVGIKVEEALNRAWHSLKGGGQRDGNE